MDIGAYQPSEKHATSYSIADEGKETTKVSLDQRFPASSTCSQATSNDVWRHCELMTTRGSAITNTCWEEAWDAVVEHPTAYRMGHTEWSSLTCEQGWRLRTPG